MKRTRDPRFVLPKCLAKYQQGPFLMTEADFNLLVKACQEYSAADDSLKEIFYRALLRGYYLGERYGEQNHFAKLVLYFRDLCSELRLIQNFLDDPVNRNIEVSSSLNNCK